MRSPWLPHLAAIFCLALVPVSACDSGGDDDDGASGDGTASSAGDGAEDSAGDGDPTPQSCGDEWVSKDPNTTLPTLFDDALGQPCTTADDCAALGPDARCDDNVFDLLTWPGGICTLPCTLPNATTRVADAPECNPDGGTGVDCVGLQGFYTACLKPCESSDQCNREGYGCRRMPNISAVDDQTYCIFDTRTCCTTDDVCQCDTALPECNN